MIPFDIRICEVLEAVMAKKPQRENLQILANDAIELMTQTNQILQRNLYVWSDEKIKMYGLRVSKYSSVIQAFASIRNGNPTHELMDLGINDGKALYTEINVQFSTEWNNAGNERRRAILEEILLPHMLFIRFLERYKRDMIG